MRLGPYCGEQATGLVLSVRDMAEGRSSHWWSLILTFALAEFPRASSEHMQCGDLLYRVRQISVIWAWSGRDGICAGGTHAHINVVK